MFPLGRVVMTRGVALEEDTENLIACLMRHHNGDWGIIPEEDKTLNDLSVVNGDRIVSKYRTKNDRDILIITEWDRSYTTILYPSEY